MTEYKDPQPTDEFEEPSEIVERKNFDATAAIQSAFEQETISGLLHMNVLNFSWGLPKDAQGPLEEILKKYMDSAAQLALSLEIPEPDMSRPDWKDTFANAVADRLLVLPGFISLMTSTKTELKTKFPAITDPGAFIDFPYYHMASYISQVAYLIAYDINPKYLILSPEEAIREIKAVKDSATNAGKPVEVRPVLTDSTDNETVN